MYLDLRVHLEWFPCLFFRHSHYPSYQPGVALYLASASWEVGYSPVNLIHFDNLVSCGQTNMELLADGLVAVSFSMESSFGAQPQADLTFTSSAPRSVWSHNNTELRGMLALFKSVVERLKIPKIKQKLDYKSKINRLFEESQHCPAYLTCIVLKNNFSLFFIL